MATIDSLNALLVDELRDIYDAEKRLTKAIPKLAKKATNDELRAALEEHLGETRQQATRLEQAFEHLGERARAKTCPGMKGIIEEGDEHAGEDYDDDDLRDAVIIGSAQRVEHYEIAAYGTAIAHARLLEQDDVVELLEESLNEEKAADARLTEIAEAAQEEEVHAMGRRRSSGATQTWSAAASSRNRSARRQSNSRRSR
jgi:ferritin-like metal-binding protein YciE